VRKNPNKKPTHIWRHEVTERKLSPFRELVFQPRDAHARTKSTVKPDTMLILPTIIHNDLLLHTLMGWLTHTMLQLPINVMSYVMESVTRELERPHFLEDVHSSALASA
jgi:hypothetical protein